MPVPMNPFPETVQKIGIPAPAGIPTRGGLERSLELIRRWGITPVVGEHVYQQIDAPYYAATPQLRADDFNRMLDDEELDLILCARGGYGSAHILPLIHWYTLRERNLPVLGYSDITALHMGMLARSAGRPVTTQMAAHLYDSVDSAETLQSMRHAMTRLGGRPDAAEIVSLHRIPGAMSKIMSGMICGPLIPANLSLLASLCGTPFLPDFKGSILLLEDVGEKPRILDRHLTQLRLCGIPQVCGAVIFGQFTDCGEGPLEIEPILKRFADLIPCPVFTGLPFGHELPCHSFLAGQPASLDLKVAKLIC